MKDPLVIKEAYIWEDQEQTKFSFLNLGRFQVFKLQAHHLYGDLHGEL